MSIPTKVAPLPTASAIEAVLIKGDLSKLTEDQRIEYCLRLCNRLGLNPMTKPFEYITMNGKLVLYATRACAEQLRKINSISIEIVSQEKADGLLTIHVRAHDKEGRKDEDLGVVAFGDNLKGDAAANTILKAITKAKRRVTLSISGLGFLDETETEYVPDDPITAEQVKELETLCETAKKTASALAKRMRVAQLSDLPASKFTEAKGIIDGLIKEMPRK